MKRTIIALMALAGVAAAGPLTLTNPPNGSLLSGNQALIWSQETGDLTSWELSFDLTPTSLSNNTLFHIGDKNNWVPTIDLYNGNIQFNQANKGTVCKTTISAGTMASITLSFIAEVTAEGDYIGGTYSVSFKQGETTLSQSIEIEEFTSDYSLADYSISKNEARFWTHNRTVTYSNITLTQLSDKLIPEPTTATLSLLALAGLAARRRRR